MTPIVSVYAAGFPAALAKCRACMVASLINQRATAAALQRPYTPALPPIPEGSLMSPVTALRTTTRQAEQPATHRAAPPRNCRPAPHRFGVLGLVWLLGNSAALPLLWAQVATAQHDGASSALSTSDSNAEAA